MNSPASAKTYREYLYPSLNTLFSIAIVWPTLWLTVYPWSHTGGVLSGALVTAALYVLAFVRAPKIELDESTLKIGSVQIPRAELGGAEALVDDAARKARGPALSPAAFVLFRGTTRSLVRIVVTSKSDPTPYWLVSSRKAEKFAAALNS
ncbi:MAG: hypothetical protein RLZZ443_261 [Actinomycetota bacterium]